MCSFATNMHKFVLVSTGPQRTNSSLQTGFRSTGRTVVVPCLKSYGKYKHFERQISLFLSSALAAQDLEKDIITF